MINIHLSAVCGHSWFSVPVLAHFSFNHVIDKPFVSWGGCKGPKCLTVDRNWHSTPPSSIIHLFNHLKLFSRFVQSSSPFMLVGAGMAMNCDWHASKTLVPLYNEPTIKGL